MDDIECQEIYFGRQCGLDDDGVLRDRRFLRRIQKIDKLSRRDKQAFLKNLDMFFRSAGVA